MLDYNTPFLWVFFNGLLDPLNLIAMNVMLHLENLRA